MKTSQIIATTIFGLGTLGLFGGGIYMVINGIPNWGWLIFAGIIVGGITYDLATPNSDNDDE